MTDSANILFKSLTHFIKPYYYVLQEEVKFCQFPELLAALLVCDEMESNEALLVKGVEQFCHCRGCGASLEFVEEYIDQSKVQVEY